MIRLLDLSGLFWATWHGAAGKPPSYPFERVVGRVEEYSRDCHIAICLDSAAPGWRREIDPAYKANRPQKEAAALEQLRRVVDELATRGYPLWLVDGMEADDIIASAATWAAREQADRPIEIVTADKDLLQLVDDATDVRVLSLTTNEVLDAAKVKAKLGVEPGKVRDYLAIVGDKSDNVPGARGVGQVGATKLLDEFGDLAGVLAAAQVAGKITPEGIEKKIVAALADIDRSAQLVTLRNDIVLPFGDVLRPRVSAARTKTEYDEGDGGGFLETPEHQSPATPPAPPPIVAAQTVAAAARASTALARAQPMSDPAFLLALEPRGLAEAFKFAAHLYDSGLFRGHNNVQSIFAVIATGRTMGIDAMTAVRGIDIIEGKPRLSSALFVGMILRSGVAKYWQLVQSTEEIAEFETWRAGAPKAVSMTYTIEEARRAGKLGPSRSGKPTPWQTNPKTMLRWRCEAELGRAVYPDVWSNVYLPGELDDGIEDAEFERAT